MSRAKKRPPVVTEGSVGDDSHHNSTASVNGRPSTIEPLLSIDDLAATLRCSRRLVVRMRSAGRLPRPILHVGRCPRWTAAQIRAWIEGGGRP
jgi:predicted DNA-binding transcriptional regulator AlpA